MGKNTVSRHRRRVNWRGYLPDKRTATDAGTAVLAFAAIASQVVFGVLAVAV